MRNFILATLLVTGAGCAGARQSWHARYDHTNQQMDPDSAGGFRNRPPQFQRPIDVSRSTEPGPSGGAGVSR